ncbi:MAG: asparaginase [bacterium]|nr:asparaginase [bacterium]
MKVTILTTGGTISKTYDEHEGALRNVRSVLDEIIANLRLPDQFIRHVNVMNKDSLDMTDEDRNAIVAAVKEAHSASDAIVLLHGTDTLSTTGEAIHSALPNPELPVILTGAMRPYEFRDSDALQNVIEALLAARLMEPGVYVAMHNRVLRFPGVEKDRQSLTFRRVSEPRK